LASKLNIIHKLLIGSIFGVFKTDS